jgi:hexokinase
MAPLPDKLAAELERLEGLFTVPTAKLKEITNHFVTELTKGAF